MKRHMKHPTLMRTLRTSRGVALIEVLITFFVLAVGLMGMSGLQVKSLQFNQGAYQRSQATVAAYDILERMRINRAQARVDAYEIGYGDEAVGDSIAANDLSDWVSNLAGNLPDGEGSISCDDEDLCTVSIRWRDRFSDEDSQDGTWETLSISSQM